MDPAHPGTSRRDQQQKPSAAASVPSLTRPPYGTYDFPKTLRFEEKTQNKRRNSRNEMLGSCSTKGALSKERLGSEQQPDRAPRSTQALVHPWHRSDSTVQGLHPAAMGAEHLQGYVTDLRLLLASARTKNTEFLARGTLGLRYQVQQSFNNFLGYFTILAKKKTSTYTTTTQQGKGKNSD